MVANTTPTAMVMVAASITASIHPEPLEAEPLDGAEAEEYEPEVLGAFGLGVLGLADAPIGFPAPL